MNKYINYHKHDHVSNIFTPDVNVKPIDYVNRILELGYDTYFTTNHGSGGDIFDSREVCDANNINCKFGIEGYIVPNALEKDSRNYHIILIPRTNTARKKLNLASSHANEEGFYYKPRFFMSDLLNNFNDDDLYITTACVAGLLKDDDSINQIFLPLYEKYGKNIMLEIQNHNADIQKAINEKAIKYHKELGLYLIAANDSHYIYPNQSKERLELLKGKGINYGDEDTFILDYPDYETFAKRFKEQGILSKQDIIEAIEQTLIFEECENIDIDKTIKMPTIYPQLTEDEKIKLLKKEITEGWRQTIIDDKIPKEDRHKYVVELRKEMKVIEECEQANIPMADYFLLNKDIFDTAINKYNGVLTRGGRGSAGGELINKMLGITQIDRLKINLPIYSERFISTSRVIENRSLADIDINVADQEPFILAMKEVLGEHQCYPMLAYGTMKESEAFRNVCRSHGFEFDEFNEIGKSLNQYRNDEYWGKYITEAQVYINTIISCSVHPCSFLLMNEDIREELGILRIGNVMCAPITSGEADTWKYLKDDILKVVVWDIIDKVFKEIKQPIMTVRMLLDNLDDKVWDLFAKGYTATLNQIDGSWATEMVMQYKPRTLEELSMFTGAIRPNFASFRDNFINRIPQSTGSVELDEVLKQTNGQIIMQECLMQYFEWLNVSPADSIGLIKKISKKKIKPNDFKKLEANLRETWIQKVGNDDAFDITWNALQDQMSYGYCSAHACAVALDCLYCAYLKSHYPIEYYTVVLNIYTDDIEKTNRLCTEMKNFNISLSNAKFRYTSSKYGYNKTNNIIYKSISSIKNIGKDTGDKLYALKDMHFNTFLDVLSTIDNNKCCNSRELEILISIGFFEEFGNPNQLLKIVELYNKFATAKVLSKDKLTQEEKQIVHKYAQKETAKQFRDIDNISLLTELTTNVNLTTTQLEQVSYDFKYLGYSNISFDTPYYSVEDIKVNKYGTPYIKLYRISTGTSDVYKIDKKWYNQFTTEYNGKLEQGDILDVTIQEKPKRRKVDDEWVEIGTELVIIAFCRKRG
jgi:DNA polymerase III alpha subunit